MKKRHLYGGGYTRFKAPAFAVAISTAAFAALPAFAGVKYWDNPAYKAYDADSYVQDGLVLNYDGIRNQGLDQPHSNDTRTWVNAANPGYFDLSRYDKATPGGAWTDVGFAFTNTSSSVGSYFQKTTGYTFPAEYTIQTLLDAKVADQSNGTCSYVLFNGGTWQKSALGIRTKSDYEYGYYFVCDTAFGGASTRPRIVKSSRAYTYGTAIVSGNTATFFEGTKAPTSGTVSTGYVSQNTTATAQTTDKLAIGGGQGSQDMTGQIKAFRLYHRALQEDELVWNRAVDEARFFGEAQLTAIPVTNAVIASTVAGLSIADVPATEPNGCYAVEASGHTFTAPATSIVNGRTYSCTGYTLEEWDDATGTWGDPVLHDGELSCAATETSRVRITWQWTAGDGIVTRYTAADYVQDGLVLHYDGIQNLGVDRPHSYDTARWKNLAPAGGYDLNFHVITGCTEPGEWRDDGYRFEHESYFSPDVKYAFPSNRTMQAALYATSLDQFATDTSGKYVNEAYFFHAGDMFQYGGALSVRKDLNATGNAWIDWPTHGYGDANARPDVCTPQGAPFQYVTAILADDYAAAFFDTTIPTAQTARWAYDSARRTLTSNPQVRNSGFGIGGTANVTTRMKFRGMLKNFRVYNRVLSNEELAANRVIDDYRFHGVMPVTNVVVATSHSFFSGSEKNGNYEISGRYTFTAPTAAQTDSRGFSYAFKGYTIEEWNAATQCWSAPVLHEGESAYEYVVGTAAAKVRLTWVWEAAGNLRTAADYGLEDYVASGLVLHYDGIKNIGADSADTTSETSRWSKAWVNLANPGEYTLTRTDKSQRAGEWATDGFAFENLNSKTGSWFRCTAPFTLAPNYTWQFLLDAKVSEQHDGTCTYPMFGDPWKVGSLGLRTTTDYKYGLYYVPDTAVGDSTGNSRAKILDTEDANSKYTYATAIIDGRKVMLFAGTEYPTDSVGLKTAPNAATQTVTRIRIGGGQADMQDYTGKIKNIRYYDRVLTPAEMQRNRQVDSARYFGELAFTNVVVAAKDGLDFAMTPVAGEYAVDGSYTFAAAAGADTPTGYKLQSLNPATGEWDTIDSVDSLSYTYDGTDGETVRILWTKSSPFVLVVR